MSHDVPFCVVGIFYSANSGGTHTHTLSRCVCGIDSEAFRFGYNGVRLERAEWVEW